MKHHESCLTGSTPFPEVNVATHNNYYYEQTHRHNRCCGHGRNHGLERVYYNGRKIQELIVPTKVEK